MSAPASEVKPFITSPMITPSGPNIAPNESAASPALDRLSLYFAKEPPPSFTAFAKLVIAPALASNPFPRATAEAAAISLLLFKEPKAPECSSEALPPLVNESTNPPTLPGIFL